MSLLQCKVKIANHSTLPLQYVTSWYSHGGAVDDWPMHIGNGDEVVVLNASEADERAPGVSGFVVYKLHGQDIAIAFSNPTVGHNKLEVGLASEETGGKNVWKEMESHGQPWAKTIVAGDRAFNVACSMTSGLTNDISVTFYLASQ